MIEHKKTGGMYAEFNEKSNTLFPVRSIWFSFSEISIFEKRAFKEMLSCFDKQEKYKQNRNMIINVYRKNKKKYLSATECQFLLKGDFLEILKIHLFLEQWKLINDQDILEKFPFQELKEEDLLLSCKKEVPLITLNLYKKEDETVKVIEKDDFCLYRCSVCKRDISEGSYYKCIRKTERDVCDKCFLLWRVPNDVSGYSYVRVSSTFKKNKDWCKEEEEKLFESVLKYDSLSKEERKQERWDFVSSMVGSKNREDCIMFFLGTSLIKQIGFSDKETLLYLKERIPFSNAKNPVMCLLTFLSSNVHVQIASFVARIIMNEIMKEKKKNICFLDLKKNFSSIIKKALVDSQTFSKKKINEYEDKIEEKISWLIENQTRKIEVKMSKLEELDKHLLFERKELEKQRLKLFFERVNMKKEIIKLSANSKPEFFD